MMVISFVHYCAQIVPMLTRVKERLGRGRGVGNEFPILPIVINGLVIISLPVLGSRGFLENTREIVCSSLSGTYSFSFCTHSTPFFLL